MTIGPTSDGLGRTIAIPIGQRLRLFYADIAAQPIPQRFTELLDRLESKSQGQDTAGRDYSPRPQR